ncbi:MAG: hypothetical protein ACE367_17320 [Acidimicrobiales bacterium]
MILRRGQPSAPEPPWKSRVAAARRIIERQRGDDATLHAQLATIEAAMEAATVDVAQLGELIAELDPERATRELKDALRRRTRDPASVDDALIDTMRRRYETIHTLEDRRSALDARIERTVADIEALAARSIELSHSIDGRGALGAELERLHTDLTALEAAHRELDEHAPLDPGERP